MMEKEVPFYNNGQLLVIRWIAGGANGMQFMDWFDVVMHGTPWVLLIAFVFRKFVFKTI